jgi:hypothetical protein
MTMCVHYVWQTKSSVMMPDGRMFYFTSTATIRQLLEALLKETKEQNG